MAAGTDDAPDALAMQPTQVAGDSDTPHAGDRTQSATGGGPRAGYTALPGGTRIGRYEIDAMLGAGGMGVVYGARDPDLERPLAIKLVRPSGATGHARVLREAQAMARLQHAHVVPVFDVGTHDGQVFLVMPLLAGGTLGAWTRRDRPSWRDVVARYLAAARGLAAAHAAGLVHRDFKPDNVLLGLAGEVQVADFGLARVDGDLGAPSQPPASKPPTSSGSRDELTQAGAVLGTPAYMAPEQIDGRAVDARADQFSFCVALFEAVWGVRPFDAPIANDTSKLDELRAAIRDGKLRSPPAGDAPRWLRDVVVRGLSDAPEARWPSMDSLIAALERGLRPPRSRAWIAAGALAVLAAGAAIAWFATRDDATPAAPRTPTAYTTRVLTYRGDIAHTVLSPDGTRIAATSGGDVLIVAVDGSADPRVLARDADRTFGMAWTRDSKAVLLTTIESNDEMTGRLIDVETGTSQPVTTGLSAKLAFVGPGRLASAAATSHAIRLTELDSGATRDCAIPGDYRWLGEIQVSGASIYVTVEHDNDTSSLLRTDWACSRVDVVLDHSDAGPVLVTEQGTLVHLAAPEEGYALAVLGPDGARRDTIPLPETVVLVIGIDPSGRLIALQGARGWRLQRLGAGPSQELAAGTSRASMIPDPSGQRLAVVEQRVRGKRELRVVDITTPDARPPPLGEGVFAIAWSPKGDRLAGVQLADDGAVTLVVFDPAGGVTTTRALADSSPSPDLAWLDDRRIAYLRAGHRTFGWIALDTGETGVVLDPEPGWTFGLAVAPSDGALAVLWNRDTRGTWMVPPGGEPVLVKANATATPAHAWSPDGKTLWIYDQDGVIERWDRATGAITAFRTLELDRATRVAGLTPLGGDEVLVLTMRAAMDLAVLDPQ